MTFKKTFIIAIFHALCVCFAQAQGNGAAFITAIRDGTQISQNGKPIAISRNAILEANELKISLLANKSLGIAFSNNVSIMVFGPADFSLDSLKQNPAQAFGKLKEISKSEMKITLKRGTFVFAMNERLLSSLLEINTPCAKISPIAKNLVVEINDDLIKITPLDGIAYIKTPNATANILKSENCAKFVKSANGFSQESLEKLFIKELDALGKPVKYAEHMLESVQFIPLETGKFTVRILQPKSFFANPSKF